MAKPKYKHYSVMVPQGGKLVTGSSSQDTAGTANYVEKINFRRETDGEVRREGWSRFTLRTADEGVNRGSIGIDQLPNQGTQEENLPIRLLTQFSSDGDMILIAGSGTSIYALGEYDEEWKLIATGLASLDNSGGGSHWEKVAIDGYLILNNGRDLPLIYRKGYPCAFPMYSLRERGIASVGTIAEFDGRLFIADITYINESIDGEMLKQMTTAGIEPYGPNIVSTTFRTPHMIEFSSWRLTNSSEAKSAPYLFGQNYEAQVSELSGTELTKLEIPYALGGVNDPNASDIKSQLNPYYEFTDEEYASYDFGNSTILVGDNIRISVTSSSGETRVYDALVQAIEASYADNKTTITLRDAYNNTSEGVVTFDGATQGENEQTLAVGDLAVIVLLKEPDIFNSDTNIAREASDSMSFPEDGSRILKMVKLGDKLAVHRETGYMLINKGDRISAFYFEERYKGERVADMRNSVININDQRQMFVGYNGVFSITPASIEPEPVPEMMMGPEFWRLISNDEIEYVYSEENSLTQEVFIVCPIGYDYRLGSVQLDWGVIAYDLLQGTVSQIDYAFTAMTNTFATHSMRSKRFLMGSHLTMESIGEDGFRDYYFPNPTRSEVRYKDTEVIEEENLGFTQIGARILRYGYGGSEETTGPYRLFNRDGADYECRLKFGKSDFADRFSEKKLRSYALHMSDVFKYDAYANALYAEEGYMDSIVTAEVKISSFATALVQPIEEVIEQLDDLTTEVMVPMYAQGNYFQDIITLKGVDQPFKILGRTFEVSGVNTKLTDQVSQNAS